MAAIYSNAVAVLAARDSPSSDAGFLVERQAPRAFEVQDLLESDDVGHLFVRPAHRGRCLTTKLSGKDPISVSSGTKWDLDALSSRG